MAGEGEKKFFCIYPIGSTRSPPMAHFKITPMTHLASRGYGLMLGISFLSSHTHTHTHTHTQWQQQLSLIPNFGVGYGSSSN